jgi:hypothetical protein
MKIFENEMLHVRQRQAFDNKYADKYARGQCWSMLSENHEDGGGVSWGKYK